MASIDRTAYPRFRKSLTEEELEHCFSLTENELTFVDASNKGDRLVVALLLKTRQHLGYFPHLRSIPSQVGEHVAKELGTDAEDSLELAVSRPSLHRYRQAIRRYLGSKPYIAGGRSVVEGAVRSSAFTMSDPADLINVAVETLAKRGIDLPAYSTLNRLVGHLRQEVHLTLYARITRALDREQCDTLDSLLTVAAGKTVTPFNALKQSPGPPSLKNIRIWADHLARLEDLLDPSPYLAGVAHTKIRQFASEAEALGVSEMLDLRQPGKRNALLLCLLWQAQTRTRDELVDMFMRRMRRTKKAALQKLNAVQMNHRDIEESLVGTFGQILQEIGADGFDPKAFGDSVLHIIRSHGGAEHLLGQYQTVAAFHQNNYLPLLWPIHANARAVLFRILSLLDIRSASQDSRLLDALSFVKAHRTTRRDAVPLEIDISFLSKQWQRFVTGRRSRNDVHFLDRRSLEVCIFLHVSNALACGDLYVEHAEIYSDPRSQLLSWEKCELRLTDYCASVGLPDNPKALVDGLKDALTKAAARVDASFPDNTELSIDPDGTPHLKRLTPKPKPEDLAAFTNAVRNRMPERHLLDILRNTNHWASYTRHFGPLSGSDTKLADSARRYIFAVFGNGCFLGDTQTARHATSPIDRQSLRRINAQHINIGKLEAALADLINEYVRFPVQRYWGQAQAAITDGTHIALTENNLLGDHHIRYGGYGGIAYHHIADNYIALFCNFIACGVWEAVYIFDGLFQNESKIQPDTLHADTQGQSEPVFGLAYLLGIQLFPRMRNWNDVKFYRPDKRAQYKHIDPLFSATIDWDLIERHWKDLMQIVLSIHAGKVLPSLILRKLGSRNRKSKLYRAFRELGRVQRTMFLLRYISEQELRFSIRAETTKIESFHSFLDWIAFGGTVIKSGDPIEQAKRVKYMDLIANAIMLHNVADLTDVLNSMVRAGLPVNPQLIRTLSPYMREHILRFGKWTLDMGQTPSPLRPDLAMETQPV